MTCPEHGEVVWRGDVRCEKCGQVYSPGPGLAAMPDVCGACRARLLPDQHRKETPWYGRAACYECVHGQGGGAAV